MAGGRGRCHFWVVLVVLRHGRDRVVVVDVGVRMVVVQGRLGPPPDRYLGWFQATGRRLVLVVMVVMAEMARIEAHTVSRREKRGKGARTD